MKISNENPSLNCDATEVLLIQRHFDEITKDKSLLVEEHLKSCDRCRSYQRTLSILQESMQIGTEERLVPHPAIRENVIRRMKTVKVQQSGIFDNIWQSVKGVFAYRVPVYQALFTVALIALIFLGVRQINLPTEREISSPEGVIQLQTPISTEVSVIDNLEIVRQQKIGRSVGDDITLTRFIVSSM
jgi:hypothetical protein